MLYFFNLDGLFPETHTSFLKWKVHNGHLGPTSLTVYCFSIYEYKIIF